MFTMYTVYSIRTLLCVVCRVLCMSSHIHVYVLQSNSIYSLDSIELYLIPSFISTLLFREMARLCEITQYTCVCTYNMYMYMYTLTYTCAHVNLHILNYIVHKTCVSAIFIKSTDYSEHVIAIQHCCNVYQSWGSSVLPRPFWLSDPLSLCSGRLMGGQAFTYSVRTEQGHASLIRCARTLAQATHTLTSASCV